MLRYEPGESVLHRLDPRVKLAGQAAVAVAAFAYTSPEGLVILTALVLAVLAAGRIGPLDALGEYGPLIPFMVAAPVVAGLHFGPPWFSPQATIPPTLASYRSVLLLAVGATYVKTTPVRESRAAVQWVVPGRFGRLLALGIAFVFRLLPLLQRDLRRIRRAARARLGGERAVTDRMRIVALGGLGRATGRADGLSRSLRARALSWHPTAPTLELTKLDYASLALAVAIFAAGIAGIIH